jgi:hypothetical protein
VAVDVGQAHVAAVEAVAEYGSTVPDTI